MRGYMEEAEPVLRRIIDQVAEGEENPPARQQHLRRNDDIVMELQRTPPRQRQMQSNEDSFDRLFPQLPADRREPSVDLTNMDLAQPRESLFYEDGFDPEEYYPMDNRR